MHHSTKLVLGLALLFVVAAAQSDLAGDDDDKTFLLSKLWKKKLHDRKEASTGPVGCPALSPCPSATVDHLVIVLNNLESENLDLLVDAPDRQGSVCITGPESDGEVICDANYIADQSDQRGLEVIKITNPVSGEYTVAVRYTEVGEPAEFDLTVYSPFLGRLVLAAGDLIGPDSPLLSTQDSDFVGELDGPGLLFTFTLSPV